MALRVLHLVGSAVSDFFAELSLLYARDCLAATADPARYEPHIAYVTPDGRWRFALGLGDAELTAAEPLSPGAALARLAALGVDVAVPQMFCPPGMTTYRAVLDLLGIPYVGNTPDVMALGAHKARARAVVASAGVRVPDGEVVRAGGTPSIPTPAVVKPVDADNSLGVSLVRHVDDYPAALRAALAHSDAALVETYVELGREVRAGILENDGRLVCLPLEEYAVDPVTAPVRSHDDKIGHDVDGAMRLMAKEASRAWIVDPADPLSSRVAAAAAACHVAMGCRHYSLFDFRIDPAGEPWFLEAGLYCSFASQSVISVMAGAAAITVPELLDISIRAALVT